jgi:hypothetical protein
MGEGDQGEDEGSPSHVVGGMKIAIPGLLHSSQELVG